jgi:hypothetical protein
MGVGVPGHGADRTSQSSLAAPPDAAVEARSHCTVKPAAVLFGAQSARALNVGVTSTWYLPGTGAASCTVAAVVSPARARAVP